MQGSKMNHWKYPTYAKQQQSEQSLQRRPAYLKELGSGNKPFEEEVVGLRSQEE
jgi:hypothetical protein